MSPPTVEDLAPAQNRVAKGIAQRLAEAGYRAWLVGGAVRDLVRGVQPSELDMVTDAHPESIEALFKRTSAVGRAFGIVIVSFEGQSVDLATLRSEAGYTDGRHPDRVRFTSSVEEDAARRDFTCNAIYLDPLSDTCLDPTGGLEDLAAGLLATVGDPRRRFAEDGLRLLRLARFLARLGARPAPGLFEAAQASLDSLRGVSEPRVLGELRRILAGVRTSVAMEVLLGLGIFGAALPAWERRNQVATQLRLRALGSLPDPPGEVLGLAWLLETDPLGEAAESDRGEDGALLETLHASTRLRRRVQRVWEVRRRARAHLSAAARARLLRDEGWREGLELARAWAVAAGGDGAPFEELSAWRSGATDEELCPSPLLTPSDLIAAGVPPGPELGELIGALEEAQLEGRVRTVGEARSWLARRRNS